MTDREFDLLLEEELSDLTPNDDLVADITPWRKAANRILIGTALGGITLNFLLLDHILPTIGLLMILLGFRSLRQENGWFRAGFVTAAVRMALCIFTAITSATIWKVDFPWLTALGLSLTVLHALCIWGGFRAVQIKAGVERNSRGFWLVVYYVVIIILSLAGFQGVLVMLTLVVLYILLLRSLWKYAALLDDAGYAVHASPVRFSDRAVGITLAVILAVGIACGYTFCSQYPMDWSEKEGISAEAQTVKEELLALGFPENVLDDLTEAEILACRGAEKVHARSDDHPINDGRQVYGPNEEGIIGYHTIYDVKELRVTEVAVEFPGEKRTFILFHHFRWMADPGFRGTDGIQVWPASRRDDHDCWIQTADYSGRVLYDRDGSVYSAPYYSLNTVTGISSSVFFHNGPSTDTIALFSLPRNGENCRGYICYSVEEFNPGHILDSWFNYYYQESGLQYPVRTAADVIIPGTAGNRGIFDCVATALQMTYDAQKAIEEGIYDFHFVG